MEQPHNFSKWLYLLIPNPPTPSLKAQFGERVWSPISLRTLWTEAESRMLAPWSLDPYSDVVAEAFGLIDRVEQDMKRVESETYVQA